MIRQSFNAEAFNKVAQPLLEEGTIGFNAETLISNTKNDLLHDGEGNYSLFEGQDLGVYVGHYFFSNKKGREALKLAKEMLQFMFDVNQATIILGATPTENKKAIWISRQLGFKYVKQINSEVGKLEICQLTEKDFNNE